MEMHALHFLGSYFTFAKNFSTGNASMKASILEGPINVRPSGLFISEAIFAMNLFAAC